ncbi:MAG: hypothetical protein LIP09_07360 [Bacteroidales bacterium]|nr:hypothetical protein [Bacteroidales bacterium]
MKSIKIDRDIRLMMLGWLKDGAVNPDELSQLQSMHSYTSEESVDRLDDFLINEAPKQATEYCKGIQRNGNCYPDAIPQEWDFTGCRERFKEYWIRWKEGKSN